MNGQIDERNKGPELDERAMSYLRGLRDYGYEEVRPPKAQAVVDFLRSLDVVIEGLMNRDLGPHLADAFQSVAGAESDERLAELVGNLEELRQATKHSEPSTRKGRPQLPFWLDRAARFLVYFYRKRTRDFSSPYFRDDDANQPDNAFTIWFCDKLRSLDPAITQSNCRTLIRRHGQKISS